MSATTGRAVRAMPAPTRLRLAALVATTAMIFACGPANEPGARSPTPPKTTPAGTAAPSSDVLGARPALSPPAPFTPPVPASYTRPNGMTVWLLERHTLPLVAVQIVVPAGSASDPDGKGGLALATANMLDEGAGARGAVEISRDVDRLGASLRTGAYADYAFASLTTLRKNLEPAAAIFGDVVAKPRMSALEWKRVHDLWQNELRARTSEPDAVASVVSARQLFGRAPYGHPTNGTLKSSASVSLEDVKRFYASAWRPERATCVVVGDVTRAELDPLLDRVFAGWKGSPAGALSNESAGAGAATRGSMATADASSQSANAGAALARRVVVVDRPDAPQSVLALVRPGVAAGDKEAAPLARVNTALGGSFTSRLNQDLREEHGWSYGARSRLSFTKARGMFAAQAAVHTEHTGDALKALIADVEALAREGLTDEEVEKTRLIARTELVEAFESVESAARRLARNAGIGLPPEHEAKASAAGFAATKADLATLARDHMNPASAIIVIVGPRAKIDPQLKAIGITSIQASSPEGDT